MKKTILLIGLILFFGCKEKEQKIIEKNVPEKVKKEIIERYLNGFTLFNNNRYYKFEAKLYPNGNLKITGILKLDKSGFLLKKSSNGNHAILLKNNKLIFFISNRNNDYAFSGTNDNKIDFSINVAKSGLKDGNQLCVHFYNDDSPSEDLLNCFEPYIKCGSKIDIRTPKQLGGGTTVTIKEVITE